MTRNRGDADAAGTRRGGRTDRVSGRTSERTGRTTRSDDRSEDARATGPVDAVLSLQRRHGNRAVQRLVADGALQPKLEVGPPDDRYEREAERVADEVVGAPEPVPAGAAVESPPPGQTVESPTPDGSGGPVRRLCSRCRDRYRKGESLDCADCETELRRSAESAQSTESAGGTPVDEDAASRVRAVRGGGRPLPDGVRSYFEPRFGREFGGVRVHTGPRADRAAAAVSARAFTLGRDVVFRDGEYDPESTPGRRLLAHELTHVVQQGGAGGSLVQRQDTGEATTAASETAMDEALSALTRAEAESRAAAMEDLLAVAAPQFLDRIDASGENLVVDVANLQLFLWRKGFLRWSELIEEEVITGPPVPYAFFVSAAMVPETMAAYRSYETVVGLKERLRTHRDESDPEARKETALEIRSYVRRAINDYPEKVETYLEQAQPSADRKTAVVGRLLAAVARLEFLAGTLAVEGTGEDDTWETYNRSEILRSRLTNPSDDSGLRSVSSFRNQGSNGSWWAWCTRFATVVQDQITGRGVTSSGYKLSGFQGSYHPDRDEDWGGAYAGPAAFFRQDENPLIDLGEELEGENETERQETVDEFFEEHIRPQAGDMMVLRRGSGPENKFGTLGSDGELDSRYSSHTTMIEKREGYTLYTIEGNKQGRVTGRAFDLTDPTHVREIVFIGRESILSVDPTEQDESERNDLGAERAGTILGNRVAAAGGASTGTYDEDDLLDPIRHISRLLQSYAEAQGYVEILDGPGTVADMVMYEQEATDSSGAE